MRIGHVVWIEGIIAAGKSTLAQMIAEALDMRLIQEPVNSNPYLERFYKEPKRWAFPMQVELLHRRYAMQKEAAFAAVNGVSSVLDRGMPGDRVFCKLHMMYENIDPLEWETYELAYEVMSCSLVSPSLLVFLDVEPEVAHERLKARSRAAEDGVPLKYLQDLRKGYLDLMCEIEAGDRLWSRGMAVRRVSWNMDYKPVEPIVDMIRHHCRL